MNNNYGAYGHAQESPAQESLLVDIDASRGGYSDGKSLHDIPLRANSMRFQGADK